MESAVGPALDSLVRNQLHGIGGQGLCPALTFTLCVYLSRRLCNGGFRALGGDSVKPPCYPDTVASTFFAVRAQKAELG